MPEITQGFMVKLGFTLNTIAQATNLGHAGKVQRLKAERGVDSSGFHVPC